MTARVIITVHSFAYLSKYCTTASKHPIESNNTNCQNPFSQTKTNQNDYVGALEASPQSAPA